MGSGKGKVVKVQPNKEYLIPNSSLMKERLVTQVHDYAEYDTNINSRQFQSYVEGEAKWKSPDTSFTWGRIERVLERNQMTTESFVDKLDKRGKEIYTESLNAFHKLNTLGSEIEVNQFGIGKAGAGIAYYNVDAHTIQIDQSLLKDNRFEDYSKWSYNTGSTPTDVVIHEFGHAVEKRIMHDPATSKAFKDFQKRTEGLEAVSPYGNQSTAEAFAEAFNLYVTGRKPESGEKYYREFEKLMKDTGKTKFKKAMPTTIADNMYKTFDEYVKDRHKFNGSDLARNDKIYAGKELDKLNASKNKYTVEVSSNDIDTLLSNGDIDYATHTYIGGVIMIQDEQDNKSYDTNRKYTIPVASKKVQNAIQNALPKLQSNDKALFDKYYNAKTKSMDMAKASEEVSREDYFKIAKWNRSLMDGENPFPETKKAEPKKMSTIRMRELAGEIEVPLPKKNSKPKETPKSVTPKEEPKPKAPAKPKEEPKPVDRMDTLLAKYSKYKTTSTLTKDYKAGKITQAEYNHILNALGKNTSTTKKVTPAEPKPVATPKVTETKVKKETKKSTVTPKKEQKKPTTTKKVEPKPKKSNVKNTFSDMSTEDFNSAVDDLLNKYK